MDARSRLQADAQVTETEAALHVVQTELRRAQEEQAHQQSHFERVRTLIERRVSSITQLEDAAQSLSVATATVEAAKARIDMASGALDRARAALLRPGALGANAGEHLLAPASGVVLDVDVISARPVAAGTRLATIGDQEKLEIVADLLSADAVRLAPGAIARVERWGGEATLNARLRQIEPKARTDISALGIEQQRVDAVFDLTSDPADRQGLGDGFAVFLRVIEWQAPSALQIPVSAPFRVGDWTVFVVAQGMARQLEVTLGRTGGRVVQVLGGLKAGEQIVTHPSDALSDGVLVSQR